MNEKEHILPILLVSLLLVTPLTLSFNKELPSLPAFSSASIKGISATNKVITTETIGFEDKSLHEWNLDEVTLDIDVDLNSTNEDALKASLGLSEEELNALIDTILAIPNNLTESNIHIFVGNFTEYNNTSVAWIAPSLITDRELTVSRDIYTTLFNISEQEAAQLEVTLPRKSGGIFLFPFTPILYSTIHTKSQSTPASVMASSITSFVPYYFGDLSPQKFLPTSYMGPEGISGIPYPFNNATALAYILPVPFTNATNLTVTGENLEEMFDSLPQSNATYEEAGDVGTFTASAELDEMTPNGHLFMNIEALESSYSLVSGILQSYNIEETLDIEEYNNRLTASLTFTMSYTGAEEFSFDIQQGDTLGYTFSNVMIEDGLFYALNETSQGNLGISPGMEGAIEELINSMNISLDCLGESFQELGLAYNMSVTSIAGDDYVEFLGNPFWPSFPYVLPKWDLQLSYFQTLGHVTHQIIPKLLSSDVLLEDILDVDERLSMDLDTDYSILGTKQEGAFEWVTLDTTMDLMLSFNETIPSNISAFNANISSHSWVTYSGDGLLTEVGISLTLELVYDSDGDNVTDTETSDSFDIELIFNRVTNEGDPIDAPDPTDPETDWRDITYYRDTTAPTVTFTSPAHDSAIDATTVTITWDGTDNVAIDHYKIRIDGGSWEMIGTQTIYDFTDLAEGMHTVEVYAMDYVENTAVYPLNFYVDVSPPTVEILSPSSDEELEESTVTVEWSGSDDASWIEYYEVRVDEGSWDNVGTDTSHDFSDLSDGDHIVNVRATDAVNRTAMDSISFTVNTSPIGGPGMLEEGAIGVGAVAIIAILVVFLRRKR